MRHSILALALFMSGFALAGSPQDNSQERFEKRFRAADKDRNGSLSRDEAYAEFPRAPEYFDQIDSNKDGRVSLAEVKKAMQKRVDAALAASGSNVKYALPPSSGSAAAANADAGAQPAFASKQEAARYHRYEYYESLAETQDAARKRNEPTMPTLMQKSF